MKLSQGIQVAALAVLALGVLAYLASPLLPTADAPAMKVVELVIAASASIGTAAAAIVALSLGLAAQRTQEERSTITAEIVASRIILELVRIEAVLAACVQDLGAEPSLDRQRQHVNWTFEHHLQVQQFVDDTDFAKLAPLGAAIPKQLALAFAVLDGLRPFTNLSDAAWERCAHEGKAGLLEHNRKAMALCASQFSALLKKLSEKGIEPPPLES